jgi:hypothetical protein
MVPPLYLQPVIYQYRNAVYGPGQVSSDVILHYIFPLPGREELQALEIGAVRSYLREGPSLLRRVCGFPQREHHPRNHQRNKPETGRSSIE